MSDSTEIRKSDVKELQKRLYSISFTFRDIPAVIPDGFYGEETQNAVKAFQKRCGIPVTGETDMATWNRISLVYRHLHDRFPESENIFPQEKSCISEGDTDPLVYMLQAMLTSLHQKYSCIPETKVSGIYDRRTSDAVRHIQKLSLYPETGKTDKYTWNHIVRMFSYSRSR